MARFDKYDPVDGGFRAPLAAAYTGAAAPIAVSVDNNGRLVPGDSSGKGIKGIICLPYDKAQYDIVDVMTDGEIVEFGGAAGTNYTANTTSGVISNAAASGTQVYVGHTVEASRLIVRVSR